MGKKRSSSKMVKRTSFEISDVRVRLTPMQLRRRPSPSLGHCVGGERSEFRSVQIGWRHEVAPIACRLWLVRSVQVQLDLNLIPSPSSVIVEHSGTCGGWIRDPQLYANTAEKGWK